MLTRPRIIIPVSPDENYVNFVPVSSSGSKWGGGGYLPNDTTPTSGNLLRVSGSLNYNILIDGSHTGTFDISDQNYSIGLIFVQGSSAQTIKVHQVDIYDYDATGTIGPGHYASGSNAGAAVYTTTDPLTSTASWTLQEVMYPIERQVWSGSGGTIYRTQIPFGDGYDAYVECTQLKVHAFSGSLQSYNGSKLMITEMKAYTRPDTREYKVSGSFAPIRQITITPSRDIQSKSDSTTGTVIYEPPSVT